MSTNLFRRAVPTWISCQWCFMAEKNNFSLKYCWKHTLSSIYSMQKAILLESMSRERCPHELCGRVSTSRHVWYTWKRICIQIWLKHQDMLLSRMALSQLISFSKTSHTCFVPNTAHSRLPYTSVVLSPLYCVWCVPFSHPLRCPSAQHRSNWLQQTHD